MKHCYLHTIQKWLCGLLLCIVTCCPNTVRAQLAQPYHQIWNVANGKLPVNSFYQVYFDSKGIGWFAGRDNLYKYFEGTFERISLGEYTTNNTVFRIQEELPGKIWITNMMNECFYTDGDSVVPFSFNDSIAQYIPKNQYINSLGVTEEKLFLGCRGRGLLCIDKNTGAAFNFIEKVPEPLDTMAGHIFIKILENGVALGSYFPPRKTNKISRYQHYFHQFDAHNNWVSSDTLTLHVPRGSNDGYARAIRLHGDTIIVAKGATVLKLNKDGIIDAHNFEVGIAGIAKDHDSNLWISSYSKGVLLFPNYDIQANPSVYFKEHYVLLKENIHDHEGGIWLGLGLEGVAYIPNADLMTYSSAEDASTFQCLAVAVDNYHNIYYSDHRKGVVKIHANRKDSTVWSLSRLMEGATKIRALIYDSLYHELWAITTAGTYVLNDNGVITHQFPNGISGAMTTDTMLWVGGYDHVFGVHRKTKVLQKSQDGFNRIEQVEAIGDTLVIKDSEEFYWLCNNELEKINPKGELWEHTILFALNDTTLLLMPGGNGFFTFKNKQFVRQQATPEHYEQLKKWRLIDIGKDELISFTKKGFLKINTTKDPYAITLIPLPVNLRGAIVNHAIMHKDTFYFATVNGLITYPKARMPQAFDELPIWIYQVNIAQKDTAILAAYELPHHQNQIAIKYGAPFFKWDRTVTYRYKMEGVNDNWITTNKTDIQYTTLPPGEYTFTVQPQKWTGAWSQHQQVIRFTILPPFWHTWWFYTLEVSLGALLGYFIILYWVGRVKRRARMQQQLTENEMETIKAQLTALQAQMNPHFIFNSLIAIQSYIYKKNVREAGDYLSRFAKLMRQMLENSKGDDVTLETEKNMLEHYFELQKLRFSDKFDYILEIDETLDPYETLIPPFLSQPFIENAIEHGIMHLEGKGHLSIRFLKQDDQLLFVLEDNGIGIDKATKNRVSEHEPMAIDITKKRLDLLNRKVEKEIIFTLKGRDDEQGTKVTFTIPLRTRS